MAAAPVTKIHNRLPWLLACWAVAQGAAPRADWCDGAAGAALFDAGRRMASFGGRDGLPRSLASVYAAAVCRFLGGVCGTRAPALLEHLAHAWRAHPLHSQDRCALRGDGAVLAHAYIKRKRERSLKYVLALVDVRTGTLLRRTTTATSVHDVAFSADGRHVLVCHHRAVDMRTLQLEVADTITLQDTAVAVDCGGDWIAIASGDGSRRDVRVLSASSRACVQWLPNLDWIPDHGFDVCLLPAQHELAVTLRDHVAVFRLADGVCVRRLGAQLLRQPERLARSCEDELVVVDARMERTADEGCWFRETRRVVVFDASGDVGAVGDDVIRRHEDVAVLHGGVVDVGVRGEFHVWR